MMGFPTLLLAVNDIIRGVEDSVQDSHTAESHECH